MKINTSMLLMSVLALVVSIQHAHAMENEPNPTFTENFQQIIKKNRTYRFGATIYNEEGEDLQCKDAEKIEFEPIKLSFCMGAKLNLYVDIETTLSMDKKITPMPDITEDLADIMLMLKEDILLMSELKVDLIKQKIAVMSNKDIDLILEAYEKAIEKQTLTTIFWVHEIARLKLDAERNNPVEIPTLARHFWTKTTNIKSIMPATTFTLVRVDSQGIWIECNSEKVELLHIKPYQTPKKLIEPESHYLAEHANESNDHCTSEWLELIGKTYTATKRYKATHTQPIELILKLKK